MTNMAKFFLIVFLVLFAIMHLVVTKIPEWVLGLAAALAALGLIIDAIGWKRVAAIMLIAVPLGATGCMGMPKLFDPDVIKELAKDRASWRVKVQTGTGTIEYERWGEGGLLPTNNGSITVSPETELRVIRGGARK